MATTFESQPLVAPLNDEALKALRNLIPQTQQRPASALERDRHLPSKQYHQARESLEKAIDDLSTVTESLNDRAYHHKTKYIKTKGRKQREQAEAGSDAETAVTAEEAEADARYEAFQKKTEELTKIMDMSIRGVIDDLAWVSEYPDTLKSVVDKVHDSSDELRRNFDPANPNPPKRRARQRQVSDDDDDDEVMQDNEEQGEEVEDASTERSGRPGEPHTLDPSETPHLQLASAFADKTRAYNSQSLTDRYARDNNYKGWKAALWDAQNPGDNPPPMPHETLWFAAEEGRSARTVTSASTQHGGRGGSRSAGNNDASFTEPGDDDDPELEISGENARMRCPITLLPYEIPMTSKNCNHSYEKTAIMQMLENSPAELSAEQEAELGRMTDTRRRTARRADMNSRQPRRVRCPDAGCNVDINGEDDLYENQLLKRRVARYLARETQKNALATSDIDEDDDDYMRDRVKGTQRKPVGVGSSPMVPLSDRRARASERVKNERSSRIDLRTSMVPDSQAPAEEESSIQQSVNTSPRSQASVSRPPRGTQIVELEDDD